MNGGDGGVGGCNSSFKSSILAAIGSCTGISEQ